MAAIKVIFAWNILLFFVVTLTNTVDSVVVNIRGVGKIRGSSRTLQGTQVDSFWGIPYAKPPTGSRRFKPPLRASAWSGIRPSKFQSVCPQRSFVKPGTFIGSEDCLFLNVFRPKSAGSKKLAVMVQIHGGVYLYGAGENFAMLAATNNVIVVSLNYRLGILGFFNIPGTNTKGNYGLMDQILALKWVKHHIADFGGDPNQVTLFGQSAGAGSITLLMLSPAAKGLFKRAIAQSGVATNLWAIMISKSTSNAASFGSSLGCKVIKSLTRCLRGKSWKQIITEQYKIKSLFYPPRAPTVDGHVITSLPISQLKQGKLPLSSVDLLLGFNKDEGTSFLPKIPKWNKKVFETYAISLLVHYGKSSKLVTELTSFEYAHWDEQNEAAKYRKAAVDVIGDYIFKVDIINFAGAWSKGGAKTFMYYFSHLPKHPRIPSLGIRHGMELPFIQGRPLYPVGDSMRWNWYVTKFTQDDVKVSLNMMKMWVNFAKTGNPGNKWPAYTVAKKEYLNIKLKPAVSANYHPRMMAYWNYYIPREIQRAAKTCPVKPSNPMPKKKPCHRRRHVHRRRRRHVHRRRRRHVYRRRRHVHRRRRRHHHIG